MAKIVFLLLAIIMIAASVVNCDSKGEIEKIGQQAREQAKMQKDLEAHSKIVGMGLTGRLASGYPGLVGSRVFPPVHAHVDGHKPSYRN